MISAYWMEVLATAGINAIVAIGLYLALLTRQLSIAHAAFMGIGGYTAAVMTRNLGFSFPLAVVAGGLAAGVIGCLLSLVIARLRMWIFAVATLGFGQVMVTVALNTPYLGGALGFHAVPRVTQPWTIFLVLGLLVFLFVRFEHSRIYQAFLATGDDEITAAVMGINVTLMRLIAFSLGCFIAGIGGGLMVHLLGGIEAKNLDFFHSLSFLIFVIVGGERTFWGALLGAAILTLLPEALRFSIWERYIMYGAILVLVMALRPRGLLGRSRLGESNWLNTLMGAIKGKIKSSV